LLDIEAGGAGLGVVIRYCYSVLLFGIVIWYCYSVLLFGIVRRHLQEALSGGISFLCRRICLIFSLHIVLLLGIVLLGATPSSRGS
jgi:hypothetical protein